MKHEDLTHKMIGCAMKVHSTLGSDFQELIYQRSMVIEMEKQGLGFEIWRWPSDPLQEIQMEITGSGWYSSHL